MRTKSIGFLLHSAREKKGLSRAQVAKKLKISTGYFGLLETNFPVYFSEKLQGKIAKTLQIPVGKLSGFAVNHNKRALTYHRNMKKKPRKKAA
jgi:transcriptional regulator with XRE-family HTH domain